MPFNPSTFVRFAASQYSYRTSDLGGEVQAPSYFNAARDLSLSVGDLIHATVAIGAGAETRRLVVTQTSPNVVTVIASNADIARASALLDAPEKVIQGTWVGIGQRAIGFTGAGDSAGANEDSTNNSFNNYNRFFIPTGRRVRALKVVYSRSDVYYTGEQDRAQAVTSLSASVDINGAVRQFFFGGQASVTLSPGRGQLESDVLWVDSGAATDFVLRGYGAWTGGLKLATTADSTIVLTGEGCNRGSSLASVLMAASGAAGPANSGSGYFPPAGVYALLDAETPVVALLGDSHWRGTGDSSPTANYGWKGFAQKQLGNALPWIYAARGGMKASDYVTRDDAPRSLIMGGGATHLPMSLGTNDLWQGRTAAQIRDDILTISSRYWFLGVKTYPATIPPRTTGTYTSAAGQTLYDAAKEPGRLAYNDDLRKNWEAYGHSGVIDMAAVDEDPAAPGKWVSSGGIARTNDGVHANTSGTNGRINAGLMASSMFTL
ncbi:hypothetical protein [Xanthobacter autotrophicus]|uniref:hypothetical protein n=1 Tax=Xanthobacter autotrophicus TaxID=280 RepID=UPI00372938F3